MVKSIDDVLTSIYERDYMGVPEPVEKGRIVFRSQAEPLSPISAQGDPLPSRRKTPAQAHDQESGVIIATPGKPIPRHARQEIIEATDEGDGLPKRIRQTNLAPQLRDAEPRDENATQSPGTRSPEELRAMMTSFQAGMSRGRREADDDPAAPEPFLTDSATMYPAPTNATSTDNATADRDRRNTAPASALRASGRRAEPPPRGGREECAGGPP